MCDLYMRIEELCNSKGITGYRLCTDIGISPNTITEMRKGRRTGISTETAAKIANYFGVSVGYLLGEEDAPSQIDAISSDEYKASVENLAEQVKKLAAIQEDHSLNKDERYLLDAYRTMTDEQKNMMNVFIRGLKNAD